MEIAFSAVPSTPVPFALHDAYPNPLNPQTTIAFNLPSETVVSLHIYDVAGSLVYVVLDGCVANQGRNEVIWQGKNMEGREVPAGIYFYRLDSGGFSETKRMALIK